MSYDKMALIRSFEGSFEGGESQDVPSDASVPASKVGNIHLVPPLAIAEKPRPTNLPPATELSGELDKLMPYGTESSICTVSELDKVMAEMEKDQKEFATFTQEQVSFACLPLLALLTYSERLACLSCASPTAARVD